MIEIAAIFDKVAADLGQHLRDEEQVLFPAIRRISELVKAGFSYNAAEIESLRKSVRELGDDHEAIGEAVHAIRALSNDYQVPEGVCNTYLLTYRKLQEFEDDLHKHVHLENNILFPKAANL